MRKLVQGAERSDIHKEKLQLLNGGVWNPRANGLPTGNLVTIHHLHQF